MSCSCSHDYFYEQQESKILKGDTVQGEKIGPSSLIKKFIKYPRLTFRALKPMRALVNFNGKKTGKKIFGLCQVWQNVTL